MAGSGPRPALSDLDAASGAAAAPHASADAGLDIFSASAAAAPAAAPPAPPLLTTPLPDPTLGGRRRPVGVGSAAAGADGAAAVPIRTVLGSRTRQPRPAFLRLRRQAGVAVLTLVTAAAGLGSAWTVRAVFAHVPKTHAPAVWGVETQGTPEKVAKINLTTPSASGTASHQASHGHGTSGALAAADDNSGHGSLSSGSSGSSSRSGRRSRGGSGKDSASSAPSSEVHHRKGRDGTGGGAGADDPATHDATPEAEDGTHKGGGSGTTTPPSTPTSEPSPSATFDDTSGSGSGGSGSGGSGGGSSGGGGGGGGGHDDFVAAD